MKTKELQPSFSELPGWQKRNFEITLGQAVNIAVASMGQFEVSGEAFLEISKRSTRILPYLLSLRGNTLLQNEYLSHAERLDGVSEERPL